MARIDPSRRLGRTLLAGACAGLLAWGPTQAFAQDDRSADVPAAIEPDTGGPLPTPAAPVPPQAGARALTVIQLGDSHTAADFLTGQVRRLLQAEFGDGGAGYVAPGKPRAGVRSSAMKIEASPGWTYSSLQSGKEDKARFALSGFDAQATSAGETITYTAAQPVSFDMIEIETVRQPGGGSVSISLDGRVESEFSLDGAQTEKIVIRLTPEQASVDRVQSIALTTLSPGPVRIDSVGVRNTRSGVSVSSVGFPGATVDIVNRFDGGNLGQELRRLNPDVVVLAFGTNEGFNDTLDVAAYAGTYRKVVRRLQKAVPNAKLVVVGPPDGNRLPAGCKGEGAKAACGKPREPATTASLQDPDTGKACIWRTPPNLARVRDVQRQIAAEERLVFWNWAEVMPGECGAHEWSRLSPPLMADDHVHMTIAGYKQSAERLAPVLRSVLNQIQGRRDALPDN